MEKPDRFWEWLGWIDEEPAERAVSNHVRIRRYLDNSRYQFNVDKCGRVAFLGGWITATSGYRPRVGSWLQPEFPHTDFDFVNGEISSTCSHTGAFRLERDV